MICISSSIYKNVAWDLKHPDSSLSNWFYQSKGRANIPDWGALVLEETVVDQCSLGCVRETVLCPLFPLVFVLAACAGIGTGDSYFCQINN